MVYTRKLISGNMQGTGYYQKIQLNDRGKREISTRIWPTCWHLKSFNLINIMQYQTGKVLLLHLPLSQNAHCKIILCHIIIKNKRTLELVYMWVGGRVDILVLRYWVIRPGLAK